MKKSLIFLVSFVILFLFSGCDKIKEYDGPPLEKLTFETVDYHGGFTRIYVFDFVNDSVSKSEHFPEEAEEFETIATFTEEQEKDFLDHCYSYGLFNLKEHYKTEDVIADGGGWTLTIKYVDGTSKTSTGDNARPTKVFNACATAFYDLCGVGVVGVVPVSYYQPPIISLSFRHEYKNYAFSNNSLVSLGRVNYKWNKFGASDNDIFALSSGLKAYFLEGFDYTLVLYTANYGNYEKFKKCVLKSYDLNEGLANEKTVLSKKWFKQVEIDLELNKIYVLELVFKDGDFVQYTFNTGASDSKIHHGEYRYDVYNEGHSILNINADGTFVLSPFHYLDGRNEGSEELPGDYGFERIDGENYLCLYIDDEKIAFDYCAMALFLDLDKTTYDVSKYNLSKKTDNQQVVFGFDTQV